MIKNKLLFVQCIIGLLAILINQLFPQFVQDFRYYLLAIAILLTGMPHGAIDHIIADELHSLGKYGSRIRFYLIYLGLMAFYTLMWVYLPLFSFILFMLITLYHFGQADAMRFDAGKALQWILHISRGITVVGLILFADPAYTSPVIESVTGFSLLSFVSSNTDLNMLQLWLAGLYPIIFTAALIIKPHAFKDKITGLLDAIVVSLLFLYCDTIWAFSVYFGLWHAFNHIRVMIRFMKLNGVDAGWKWFYKRSFLFSLISYLGILGIYFVLNAFGNENLLVFLLFIAIAVVTLPHMLIVEKMYGLFGHQIAGPHAEENQLTNTI